MTLFSSKIFITNRVLPKIFKVKLKVLHFMSLIITSQTQNLSM